MSFDTISSGGPPQDSPFGPGSGGQRPLRSGARATALTTAVSLVLIGGVVTAALRGGNDAPSAASLVPSTAFAYAQVDLRAADGQSSALSSFLGHFPDAPVHGQGSLRDRILGTMLRNSEDPHVDYAKDVKPWLGDHAAVAGWLDGSGKPQVEFLLESKDDAAARASMRRMASDAGVALSDGYVVLGRTQQLATAAVSAAHHSALAGVDRFRSDVNRLSGPQIMTAWIDSQGSGKALQSETRTLKNPLSTMPGGMFLRPASLGKLKGRAVMGLHVTSTYAELDVQAIDGGAGVGGASTDLLTQLPDATIGAAEIGSPGRLVALGWGYLSMFLGATGSLTSSNSAAAIQKSIGLTMPGDAVAVLGSAAVLSYGGLHGQGLPNVALVTRPADVSSARAIAEHARDVIGGSTGVRVAVGATSSDLIVASDPAYESAVEAGGHLGRQQRFTTAMGDLPDSVSFAAYVDLAAILPLVSHGQPDVDHLDALGLWVSSDRVHVRLVVR